MNYKEIVDQMIDANVPARISLTTSDEVLVEMGMDYPDDISDVAMDILTKSGMKFSLCAEAAGYSIKESTSIHGGGPRKRWPYRREEDDYDY
jgi:hypothetical protein